ncbi:TPA: hypothetical protein J1054_003568, partial [Escherichia coli]|nr:hypothetical protein [Escherichia coli]
LDENDIAKMLRQNILPAFAVQKAIEMIEINLMAGYLYDGGLLLALSNLIGSNYFSSLQLLKLKNIIGKFDGNMLNASAMSDEEKKLYSSYFKLHVLRLRSLTPVTYLCKLLGIHSLVAFLQLELFRVYLSPL